MDSTRSTLPCDKSAEAIASKLPPNAANSDSQEADTGEMYDPGLSVTTQEVPNQPFFDLSPDELVLKGLDDFADKTAREELCVKYHVDPRDFYSRWIALLRVRKGETRHSAKDVFEVLQYMKSRMSHTPNEVSTELKVPIHTIKAIMSRINEQATGHPRTRPGHPRTRPGHPRTRPGHQARKPRTHKPQTLQCPPPVNWTEESVKLLRTLELSPTTVDPVAQLEVIGAMARRQSLDKACRSQNVDPQEFGKLWKPLDVGQCPQALECLLCGVLLLVRKALSKAAIAAYLCRDEAVVTDILQRLGVRTVLRILPDLEDSKTAMLPRKISKTVRLAVQEECERLELPIYKSSQALDLCEIGVALELAADLAAVPRNCLRSAL